MTFSKGDALRYIGHLDVARLWERALRRAALPLAYTQGFTPHPRLTFAAPLALGATSEAELLDIYLTECLSAESFLVCLRPQLPPGCDVVQLERIELEAPSVTSQVRWMEYRVSLGGGATEDEVAGEGPGSRWSRRDPEAVERFTEAEVAEAAGSGEPWRPRAHRLPPLPPDRPVPAAAVLAERIRRLLAASQAIRQRVRDGKVVAYDLRPLVYSIWVCAGQPRLAPGTVDIGVVVRADAAGAGRPEEVAAALGTRARHVHRVRIGLEGMPPPHIEVTTAARIE